MKSLLYMYSWKFSEVIVYMLQGTEYKVPEYLKWLHRIKNFATVMYRRRLERTRVARLLLITVRIGMLVQLGIGLSLAIIGYKTDNFWLNSLGVLLVLCYPVVWAYIVTIPLQLGRWIIINPKYRRQIRESEKIFSAHKGIKIAIAGSYGKTSMKEMLHTVLKEGKKVVATPANKNVAISHARFAQKLHGDEEILIIEYGEGGPGDVENFAKATHPNIGIITGLAPAHLDNYPDLESAGKDIFSLKNFVDRAKLFVNGDSAAVEKFLTAKMQTYSSVRVMGWKISNIQVGFDGTSFMMAKGDISIHLHSGLIGEHNVGPLAFVVAFAHSIGLSKAQIGKGIKNTKPFQHRMEPRSIRGAWIIDDTYNGNIDGMKAGLKLLKQLPGSRKTYVTPGLVDQGVETIRVHHELGKAIAIAAPDKVVLMHNSVTDHITEGMKQGGYKGAVQVEHYPLDYYVNLEHFLAAGDVVLLQNDWTDNYN